MDLDSPVEVGRLVATASRTISGSSLTSMLVSLSATIQGQQWPQAGFLQELRLQPWTTERESHFLRREGGWGVSAWGDGRGGGGGGKTSSFVNVLAGNQGESLKGVPFLFLLFPLFCLLSFVFCHHASVVYFTSALSFSHFPPFPHAKLFLSSCYLSNLKTNTLTNN